MLAIVHNRSLFIGAFIRSTCCGQYPIQVSLKHLKIKGTVHMDTDKLVHFHSMKNVVGFKRVIQTLKRVNVVAIDYRYGSRNSWMADPLNQHQ